ncbi:MAG: transposase [Sphaerochaetaceae bacterium]|jgi:transposase
MSKTVQAKAIADEQKGNENSSKEASFDDLLVQFGVDASNADASLLGLCRFLFSSLQAQKEQLSELNANIRDLISRLQESSNKNSKNSSLPPSKEGYKKPPANKNTSLRQSSGKSPGAQEGHKGSGLKKVEADEIIRKPHFNAACQGCPNFCECREKAKLIGVRHNYQLLLKVVDEQHEAYSLACPKFSGMILEGSFPDTTKSVQQYGESMREMVIQLWAVGIVSIDRIQKIISERTGLGISTGTISSYVKEFAGKCDGILPEISNFLKDAPVKGADETGIRAEGELQWIHTVCNESATYLYSRGKRGYDTVKEEGLLTTASGIIIHDCLPMYFKLNNLQHGVCIQHLLRETNAAKERSPEHADELSKISELLREMKKAKEERIAAGYDGFTSRTLKSYLTRYNKQLRKLLELFPAPPKRKQGKQGRQAEGKTRSFLLRLKKHRDAVFLFATNFKAWFTNNYSEISFRISKVKESVSKCFRKLTGLKQFISIISVLDTAKKHGCKMSEFIRSVFRGEGKDLVSKMLFA